MSTEYTASVRIEDGTLTVVRPHPSIGPVDDLVDSLVYTVRDDSTIRAVEVTVEVDDTPQPGDQPTPQTGTAAPTLPPVPPPAPDPLAPFPGANTAGA